MFGSMKKAMVVAAVAAVSALAPAVASANEWKVGGSPYAGSAEAVGNLTLTLQANGSTKSCDVRLDLGLTNPGGVAAGTVGDALLGVPVLGTPCVTSLPGCALSVKAWALPWNVATSGASVTIAGLNITTAYSGASCVFNGMTDAAWGAITGTAAGDRITFSNAGPLTTPFGPSTVSGSVLVAATPGGAPVSLG